MMRAHESIVTLRETSTCIKWQGLVVVAILALQAVGAWGLMCRYSVTINEAAHIPAGLAGWHHGDFSLYNVNPPLAKLLATAPLLVRDDVSLAALRVERTPRGRDEFAVGYLFSETNRSSYHGLVVTARAMGLFWLFAGGLLLWRFASEMHGNLAGLVAVGFWVSEPFVTAHGVLATPDLPGTVMALATIYVLRKYLQADKLVTVRTALPISIVLGCAILVKFTNLLLVIVVAAIVIVTHFRTIRASRPRLASLGGVFLCGTAGVTLTIWCGYLFDGFGTPLGDLSFKSQLFVDILGSDRPFVDGFLKSWPSPLPPEMLYGIDVQQVDFEGCQQSYLRGVTSSSGWAYYYAYSLLVKMTLGGLLACGLGILLTARICLTNRCVDSAAILLPLIIYFGVVSLKHGYTNHARYVLPCIPFLILCAARLAEPVKGVPVRLTRCLVGILVAASAVSAWSSYPDWLGYFNETAGGPKCGWWHLEDSNVDWGQDLILLREWMDSNPEAKPIAVRSHHLIDLTVYLGDRTAERKSASYVAVDAYSLVHNEQELWRNELVDRVGTSFFIFRVQQQPPNAAISADVNEIKLDAKEER